MNIIFQINGGIGKCVMATAVCEAIKKQYPDCKLIVVSAYADAFTNSPFVDRALTFGSFNTFTKIMLKAKRLKSLPTILINKQSMYNKKNTLLRRGAKCID
jgi:ADP-heptose:LPS heptosyltransferase